MTNSPAYIEEWMRQHAVQAVEIQRLRFALYGCLVASKDGNPSEYAIRLAFVQEKAHEALYGDKVEMKRVDRVEAE